jgi:hypothetical protein
MSKTSQTLFYQNLRVIGSLEIQNTKRGGAIYNGLL